MAWSELKVLENVWSRQLEEITQTHTHTSGWGRKWQKTKGLGDGWGENVCRWEWKKGYSEEDEVVGKQTGGTSMKINDEWLRGRERIKKKLTDKTVESVSAWGKWCALLNQVWTRSMSGGKWRTNTYNKEFWSTFYKKILWSKLLYFILRYGANCYILHNKISTILRNQLKSLFSPNPFFISCLHSLPIAYLKFRLTFSTDI